MTFALLVFAPATANAVAVCSLSSTGVAFGTFSGSQLTAMGTITIHCTGSGTSKYQLTLSSGSGTYATRQMTNRPDVLSYNLYTTSSFSQVWGDGTSGTTFNSGQIKLSPPPSVDIVVTVFGNLPAQTLPASGNYMDTIVATLTCTSGGACTTTTSFAVTASSQPACMLSATNLDFGTYIENQLDGQSTITVTCTNGTAWEVGLNAGSSLGATVNSRSMTGPGLSSLSYNLFTDPARTITWGFRPLLPGQETVSGVGTGAAQVSAVYGRIPANDRSAAPGAFTDTITATVTF